MEGGQGREGSEGRRVAGEGGRGRKEQEEGDCTAVGRGLKSVAARAGTLIPGPKLTVLCVPGQVWAGFKRVARLSSQWTTGQVSETSPSVPYPESPYDRLHHTLINRYFYWDVQIPKPPPTRRHASSRRSRKRKVVSSSPGRKSRVSTIPEEAEDEDETGEEVDESGSEEDGLQEEGKYGGAYMREQASDQGSAKEHGQLDAYTLPRTLSSQRSLQALAM